MKQFIIGTIALVVLSITTFSTIPAHNALGLIFGGATLAFLLDNTPNFPEPGKTFTIILATLANLIGIGLLLYFGLKML